jgi:hypothetical protein
LPDAWSQLECEAIARDYFEMFRAELVGKPYSKAVHRRALQKLLDNRSEGSIEYKHQNISAILLEAGYPYIPGYKPAFNYQALLKDVVFAHMRAEADVIETISTALSESLPERPVVPEWTKIISDAPELLRDRVAESAPKYIPRKYNYAERESRNRRLGELGEELVLAFEKHRLEEAGRTDLAGEVEWTSKERGDGAGYDIRSFDETRDEERFIEVKTTNSGKYQPFLISDNEVAFSAARADSYCLYRVFDFRQDPHIFLLPGDISRHVNLVARLYRASF